MRPKTVLTVWIAAVLALAVVAAPQAPSGKKNGPANATPAVSAITEQEEAELARRASELIEKETALFSGVSMSGYVQDLGERLASHAGKPGMSFQFRVLQDPRIGAMALPGGIVYTNRGLVSLCRSESELASVLAHGIAHSVRRSGLQQLKVLLGDGSLPPGAASLRELFGNHTAEGDMDTDRAAVLILRSAGISPLGMVTLLGRVESLPAAQETQGSCFAASGVTERKARVSGMLLASDSKLPADSRRFQRERWRLSVDELFPISQP